jgi:hypothetical protein
MGFDNRDVEYEDGDDGEGLYLWTAEKTMHVMNVKI